MKTLELNLVQIDNNHSAWATKSIPGLFLTCDRIPTWFVAINANITAQSPITQIFNEVEIATALLHTTLINTTDLTELFWIKTKLS